MTRTEARKTINANASMAVGLFRAWKELGIDLSVEELAESVLLSQKFAEVVPPPADDFCLEDFYF